MAGVRHHILPKFLLKGFASRTNGEAIFTWVHRKEGRIFEASIVDVAVERHFYGRDEDLNIDESITSIESDFGVLVDHLRRQVNGFDVSHTKIADLVTHLSSRTKHLRDSFLEASDTLIGLLTSYLADSDNFGAWLFDYYRRHPEVIRQSVDEALNKMALTRPQRRVLRRKLLTIQPEALFTESSISQEALLFATVGPTLLDQLPEIVKRGHIKALAKSLVPEPRAEQYRRLQWKVFKTEEPLILGDVGCVFQVGGDRFVSTSGKEDDLKAVLLPIATNTLVIGTIGKAPREVIVRDINATSAKISRDFFVSFESSAKTQALMTMLGEESEILKEDEIRKLVKEAILES